MNLYILESIAEAKALAKAFGCRMEQSGKHAARIYTGDSPSLLFWRDNMRLLSNTKRPALNEQMEEILSGLFEKEDIREIFCLLFPTKTSLLFADCIRRKLDPRGADVYLSFFTTLKKEDILFALEHAKRLSADDPDTIRATGERHSAYALAGALKKIFPEEDMPFDLAMLCALFLIDEREGVRDQKRYRLETAIETGEKNLSLLSCDPFTREAAEKAIEGTGKKLSALSPLSPLLPSAIALCSVYDGFAPKDLHLKEKAEKLFEKGYISNPFTLSGAMPENADAALKSQIIAACRAQHPEEEGLTIDALSPFEAQGASLYSAVLPLKDSAAALTEPEETLYRKLISCVKTSVCENNTSVLRFADKKSGLTFSAPLSSGAPLKKQHFSPGPITIREEGAFQSYAPAELMEKIASFGLDSSDVILSLLQRLLSSGAIYSDTLGLHLTPKGAKAVREFPATSENVFSLFRRIYSQPDDPADINAHLVRVSNEVSRTAAGWLSGEKKGPPKKENPPQESQTDEPDPAAPEDTSRYVPCPFCSSHFLTEDAHAFICRSCGAEVEKMLKIEDAYYSITEKDILALSENGRTKFKRGKNDLGEIITGGYITLSDSALTLSHRSGMRCPHCKENLSAYAWGFSCPCCGFGVPFEIYHVRLKTGNLKKLLAGEKTELIENLISPQGEIFSARLCSMPGGKVRAYKTREDDS